MQSFFSLAAQCCDAINYLQLGTECANSGVCHGPLRPVADYYWFSLPYRLGLSTDILVLLNISFMCISVWFAARAFMQLLATDSTGNLSRKKIHPGVIFVASLLLHGIFFYPALYNSLTDAPASALFLNGIWLLILSAYTSSQKNEGWLLISAGLCWGLAAWLRAFFLYPVLCALFIYGCFWLINRQRRWLQLALMTALLPIGIQFVTMYNVYGKFSYLNDEEIKYQSRLHLSLPVAGYDTYLPHDGHFWNPRNCQARLGILNGLQQKQFADVLCVIQSRAYFYLGTYIPVTYPFPGGTHYLVQGTSESIGSDPKNWWTNLILTEDAELAPSGLKTADKLTTPVASAEGFGNIKQWISLEADTTYTFSVWLWSPLPRTINLGITQYYDEHVIIALEQFVLTPQPRRYSVTGQSLQPTLYNASIGSISPDKPITFGTQPGDYFYAWGAQLEAADHPTAYAPDEPIHPDSIRVWRPALLGLNIMALVLACGFIISRRSFFVMQAKGLAMMAGVSVCVVEAITIIPEQRFFIAMMVFIWLNAAATLHGLFNLSQPPVNAPRD